MTARLFVVPRLSHPSYPFVYLYLLFDSSKDRGHNVDNGGTNKIADDEDFNINKGKRSVDINSSSEEDDDDIKRNVHIYYNGGEESYFDAGSIGVTETFDAKFIAFASSVHGGIHSADNYTFQSGDEMVGFNQTPNDLRHRYRMTIHIQAKLNNAKSKPNQELGVPDTEDKTPRRPSHISKGAKATTPFTKSIRETSAKKLKLNRDHAVTFDDRGDDGSSMEEVCSCVTLFITNINLSL